VNPDWRQEARGKGENGDEEAWRLGEEEPPWAAKEPNVEPWLTMVG